MTLDEFQAELEKRHATTLIGMYRKSYAVTVSEDEDHANMRDARPSDRGYGHARDDSLKSAVAQALQRYDLSLKRPREF